MDFGEARTERRISFRWGVNSSTLVGFDSYENLVDKARQSTMGDVEVTKREERTVIYGEWWAPQQ